MTSDDPLPSLKVPRRIPIWMWLMLLPALLIGLNQLRKGGRERVEIVGAGPVSVLRTQDAPENLRFYPKTQTQEDVAATKARIFKALKLRPSILVFGFDLRHVTSDDLPNFQTRLARVHQQAESVVPIPVSVGPRPPPNASTEQTRVASTLRTWWRSGPCQEARRLLCIDVFDASDPDAMRIQLQAGIQTAVRRLGQYRATTQRGR